MNLIKTSLVSLLTLGSFLPLKSNAQPVLKNSSFPDGINFFTEWVDKNRNKYVEVNELLNLGKNTFAPGDKVNFYVRNSDAKNARIQLILKNLDTGKEESLGSVWNSKSFLNHYYFALANNVPSGNYEVQAFFPKQDSPLRKRFQVNGQNLEDNLNEPLPEQITKFFSFNYVEDKNSNGVVDNLEEFVGYEKHDFGTNEQISFGILSDDPIITKNPYRITIYDISSNTKLYDELVSANLGAELRYNSFRDLSPGKYKVSFNFENVNKCYSSFFNVHNSSY